MKANIILEMHTQLAKSVYKTALRRAIAFDKEPILKVRNNMHLS